MSLNDGSHEIDDTIQEFFGHFIIFKMDSTAQRYDPLKQDHIPGFPNYMPCVDWQNCL